MTFASAYNTDNLVFVCESDKKDGYVYRDKNPCFIGKDYYHGTVSNTHPCMFGSYEIKSDLNINYWARMTDFETDKIYFEGHGGVWNSNMIEYFDVFNYDLGNSKKTENVQRFQSLSSAQLDLCNTKGVGYCSWQNWNRAPYGTIQKNRDIVPYIVDTGWNPFLGEQVEICYMFYYIEHEGEPDSTPTTGGTGWDDPYEQKPLYLFGILNNYQPFFSWEVYLGTCNYFDLVTQGYKKLRNTSSDGTHDIAVCMIPLW